MRKELYKEWLLDCLGIEEKPSSDYASRAEIVELQ